MSHPFTSKCKFKSTIRSSLIRYLSLAIRIKFANFKKKTKISHYINSNISISFSPFFLTFLLNIPISRSFFIFTSIYQQISQYPNFSSYHFLISSFNLSLIIFQYPKSFSIHTQRPSIRQTISLSPSTFFSSIYYNYTSGRCSLGGRKIVCQAESSSHVTRFRLSRAIFTRLSAAKRGRNGGWKRKRFGRGATPPPKGVERDAFQS